MLIEDILAVTYLLIERLFIPSTPWGNEVVNVLYGVDVAQLMSKENVSV